MADIQREQFIADINRMKAVISSTNSEYLKRDYQKALKRKYKELKMYDRFHKDST